MSYAKTVIGDAIVEIWGEINGKYYPATQWEPAEYPEAEITEISVDGKDFPEHFWPLLSDHFDVFETLLLEAPRDEDYD
jgi:hypothetical protein